MTIDVTWKSCITVLREAEPTANPTYEGWRVLHKVEGGWPNTPAGMPEVMPPMYSIAIDMSSDIQMMSYELMHKLNDQITGDLWRKVHSHDRAFTNKPQNGFDGGTPHADFVNMVDLTTSLPRYDKAQRVCGGMFLRGVVNGSVLTCHPGIHGIDANKPMPSVQTIIENNWFVYAVSTGVNNEAVISHFPQGKGGPVAIPFIFSGLINFPLEYLEPWEADTLPDPLKIYH